MVRHLHFLTKAGGSVSGIQSLHHDTSILAGGVERLLTADAAGKVAHFLRNPVVPMLLENRIAPALRRGSLLHRITKPVFAVSRQRIAHVQVGICNAGVAVYLRAIGHASGTVPTIFD